MPSTPSPTAQDYLKHIYELERESSPVKPSHLAEAMQVSPAAVTEMLKRLSGQQLVQYRPYRGVSLTAHGRRQALLVVRRHRIWETFLFRKLGVPFGRLHHYACRLEHGTDEHLAAALSDLLGDPRFDPHGEPIPSPDGTLAELTALRLDNLEPGAVCEVTELTRADPRLKEYLRTLGVVPGAQLQVVDVAPFNGPLTLGVDGRRFVLGRQVAHTVVVRSARRPGTAPPPAG